MGLANPAQIELMYSEVCYTLVCGGKPSLVQDTVAAGSAILMYMQQDGRLYGPREFRLTIHPLARTNLGERDTSFIEDIVTDHNAHVAHIKELSSTIDAQAREIAKFPQRLNFVARYNAEMSD